MPRPLLNLLPVAPYNHANAAHICAELAKGVTLARILREWPTGELGEAPARWTVMGWTKTHAEFKDAYDHGRDLGYDVIADDIVDIAEDGSKDLTTRTDRNGNEYEVTDYEVVARSKLRIQARQQLLAVWSPRYRPQQGIQLSNPEGGPVEFTDAAASAKIASLLSLAKARKDGVEEDVDTDVSDLA